MVMPRWFRPGPKNADEEIERLMETLRDSRPRRRLRALLDIPPALFIKLQPVIELALTDPDERVRLRALEASEEAMGAGAIPYAHRSVTDANDSIRLRAAAIFSKYAERVITSPGDDAARIMSAFLPGVAPGSSLERRMILELCSRNSVSALPQLLSAARRSTNDVHDRVCLLLAQAKMPKSNCLGHQELVSALIDLISDNGHGGLHLQALTSLLSIDGWTEVEGAKRALRRLWRLAHEDYDSEVICLIPKIIGAIGRIGGLAEILSLFSAFKSTQPPVKYRLSPGHHYARYYNWIDGLRQFYPDWHRLPNVRSNYELGDLFIVLLEGDSPVNYLQDYLISALVELKGVESLKKLSVRKMTWETEQLLTELSPSACLRHLLEEMKEYGGALKVPDELSFLKALSWVSRVASLLASKERELSAAELRSLVDAKDIVYTWEIEWLEGGYYDENESITRGQTLKRERCAKTIDCSAVRKSASEELARRTQPA